jgi:predicted nucleic acid-binding protein
MITVDACVWVSVLDSSDALHEASFEFWKGIASKHTVVYAPSFVLVEVGCAVARRTQSDVNGRNVVAFMRKIPILKLVECDSTLINRAIMLGAQNLLCAADALYLAVAKQTKTHLITWDKELILHADAVSPATWRS